MPPPGRGVSGGPALCRGTRGIWGFSWPRRWGRMGARGRGASRPHGTGVSLLRAEEEGRAAVALRLAGVTLRPGP